MTHSIQELLNAPGSQIGKLMSKAQALETLNHTLAHIETDLTQHCRVGGFDSGILTLFTHNAALATRLRYAIPKILTYLRAIPTWAGLCQIHIKVHQPCQTIKDLAQTTEKLPPLKLSAENAKAITSLAQSLRDKPGMEKLIASLLKIAKHGDILASIRQVPNHLEETLASHR